MRSIDVIARYTEQLAQSQTITFVARIGMACLGIIMPAILAASIWTLNILWDQNTKIVSLSSEVSRLGTFYTKESAISDFRSRDQKDTSQDARITTNFSAIQENRDRIRALEGVVRHPNGG